VGVYSLPGISCGQPKVSRFLLLQKDAPLLATADEGVRLECNKYPPYPIFVKKLKKVKRKIMLKILV
jgi:hypothetical protein